MDTPTPVTDYLKLYLSHTTILAFSLGLCAITSCIISIMRPCVAVIVS